MRKKTFIIILFIVLLGTSWLSATSVEFPLIQSFSYFPYIHHDRLAKHDFRLTWDIYYSNVYMYDPNRTTINDMEVMNNTFELGYGLTDWLTLELHGKFMLVHGGRMDKLIMDFHDLFGLSVGGREDFPRNQVNYKYKDAFNITEGTTVLAPLVVGGLVKLYEKNNFYLNGRLSIGLPVSTKTGFTNDNLFFTTGLIGGYHSSNKRFSVYWANHFSFFQTPGWLNDEDTKTNMIHSEIRLDYRRLFLGFLYRSSPLKEGDLSHAAYQMYFGVKIWKCFELALIEEFPPMDSTPDVTFQLRIKLK